MSLPIPLPRGVTVNHIEEIAEWWAAACSKCGYATEELPETVSCCIHILKGLQYVLQRSPRIRSWDDIWRKVYGVFYLESDPEKEKALDDYYLYAVGFIVNEIRGARVIEGNYKMEKVYDEHGNFWCEIPLPDDYIIVNDGSFTYIVLGPGSQKP